MENTKVLFVSQEVTPYLPESEISLISRHLPQGVQERGCEIRTFMPRFGLVKERRNQLHEVIRLSGLNLIINDNDHPLIIKVASIQAAKMQVYFIDNDDYFQREYTITDENGIEFEDNDERAIFFSRGVIETTKKLRWTPDIVHCHGWFTGITPLLIKKTLADDPFFANAKVVYSVYDDEFSKPLNSEVIKKLGTIGIDEKDVEKLQEPDYINFTKMAIDNSDAIIQGSEKINPEILAYIKESKKPFLEYQNPEDYIDAYKEFYDLLVPEE